MNTNKKWFTLVELIVTITILAILWTIAFISFWNFTMWARDSVRTTDTKSISRVVENYRLNTWIYPKPSNPIAINYKWWAVFWQWTFWEATRRNIWARWNINEIPIDPLYDNEYTYSLQSTNRSYNLAYIIEWELANNIIKNKLYANQPSQREVLVQVKWDFNWQIAHTSTWWKVYVFAIPSIVVSDLSDTNILSLSNKFVYNNEPNIPEIYSGSLSPIWSFDFTPKLIYSWSTLPKTPTQLKKLIVSIKDAITWTYLYSKDEYRNLIEIDVNETNEVHKWWEMYISEELWWRLKLDYAKTCKEIQGTEDDNGSGIYTISPNRYNKVDVYCDMDTDWWGWTRIKKWSRIEWLTEWNDIRKTKGIYWNEAMVTYTRYWKIRKNLNWSWIDVNMEWKKYWYQYKKFNLKQAQEWWLCWEYSSISDLIKHMTSWSWWDCSRSGNTWVEEYNDILVDDLWTDIWIEWWDKLIDWFSRDPCINNWHKTSARNTSWYSDWRIQHRIDSKTSLIMIWGWGFRCDWTVWSPNWLNLRAPSRRALKWINNVNNYVSWINSQEVWVR